MICVDNVSKWFGQKKAVDGVSFKVEKGEVLGFLGPNGAGKSTTMRMITGFIPADEGGITIGGYDVENHPIKAKSLIGYLPENAPGYGDMSVGSFLKFTASLRGLSGKERDIAIEKAIEACFLQPVRNQPIDTLSKGYRHRTCFAQSIIHDPEALIMDEPTDGLDPNQKHEVRNLIRRMAERKAIILSTHILEEVDAVCTRVVVINNGKLVANSVPAELRSRSKLARTVTLKTKNVSYADLSSRLANVDLVDKTMCIAEKDGFCQARVFPNSQAAANDSELAIAVYNVCVESQWSVCELTTEQGKLDEVFRSITTSDVDEVKN